MPAQEENKTLRFDYARLSENLDQAFVELAEAKEHPHKLECDTLKAALAAMTDQKDMLLERAAKQADALTAIGTILHEVKP